MFSKLTYTLLYYYIVNPIIKNRCLASIQFIFMRPRLTFRQVARILQIMQTAINQIMCKRMKIVHKEQFMQKCLIVIL